MKNNSYTAYIEQDEDGMFIGSIPSIPSCHAQGKTQEKMLKNLKEVLGLCLRNNKEVEVNQFVGIQNLNFSHA